MPIFDVHCPDCGFIGEILQMAPDSVLICPACGSTNAEKRMSVTSSLTGRTRHAKPGPQDTACCGSRPAEAAGCAGPGSCCGKNP